MEAVAGSAAMVNFMRALHSPDTIMLYTHALNGFISFMKLRMPDDLLLPTAESIENSLMDWIAFQKKDGVSSKLIRARISGVKKFYIRNRKQLNWEIVHETVGKGNRGKKDRAPSREELIKVMEFADLREKCIILLGASAGIRRGGILGLKKKDLQLLDQLGIYRITVYADEEEEYSAYCTPECRKAIESYFEYRVKSGEVVTDKSWVIRNKFDPSALKKEEDLLRIKFARPIGPQALTDALGELWIRSGLRKRMTLTEGQKAGKVRHDFKAVHGLRKYFDTHLAYAGIHVMYSELLQGRQIRDTKGSYQKPTDDDLLFGNNKMHGYVDAIDELTIDESNRLKRENVQLKDEKTHWEKHATKLDAVIEKLEKKGLL